MNNALKYIEQLEDAFQNIIKDVAVLAADEFDKNFKKQSFFGEKWKPSDYVKRTRQGGSLLQKTGSLRRSINYNFKGDKIVFSSNITYAEIHNEGGIIKHPGGTAYFKKKGKTTWESNRKASGEDYPRTKAHDINMPQRQFIGGHPKLDKMIEKEIDNIIEKIFK
ncbi:MAG: phage virion morphogenesis protein [Bacteroidales bacterium]|nr:phage virion morphogenesis protein [Bacteroidales bacterium]